MRDFLPADIRRRQYVIRTIAEVYERYGFEPLETPAVENLETLLGKYGDEGNQLIFKILKRGEHEATGQADLALRYDLTVPLARVVANYRAELPRLFKRYQIQPVWRADRPARGRFREFYQCDVDVLGSTSTLVETELCAAAAEALVRLGFATFTIRLNHRQLLAALLDVAGVPLDKHAEALVALDKLDKIGVEKVRAEMEQRGLPPAVAERALALFDTTDPSGDVLAGLETAVGQHVAGREAIAQLREIVSLTDATPAAGRLKIDPTLARGLSYYTGAIMEIAVPDLAGSLGGGGRYDNLVGMFSGETVPASGFSLGLERIIVVMTERGMFPEALARAAADVMVAQWSAETRSAMLTLAQDLRARGLRVELYPDADKLGKQFKHAAARQVPFVAVLGEDELAAGEVTLKDLRTGSQQRVPRNLAADTVSQALSR
jgi:histidyl-tRNA synthetase